jgi:hypothetical protein
MVFILIISLILIGFGYFTLFTLDPNLAYEKLVFEVRVAQISIIIGSFLLAFYLYKRL